MTSKGAKTGVAALERALKIMDAFTGEPGGHSLTKLSEKTGLYKSTILRLTTSLERYGYLSRLQSGQFVLGPTVFCLGKLYQQSFKLEDHVRPVLHKLGETHRESATFWILDGKHRICLFRVDSPQPIRDAMVKEGDRLNLDGSATAQALQLFSGRPTSSNEKARSKVVFVSLGGYTRDLAGVSCPVFADGTSLAGVITVAGPMSRFDEKAVAKITGSLIGACRGLSRQLGGVLHYFDHKSRR